MTPRPVNPIRLTRAQARAAVLAAQGLASPRGPLGATVERTGFLRTLGGVEVYLAARARVPGMKAKDVDAATASRQMHVVPSVRGCIYLVAARDVALSLRTADLLTRERMRKDRERAGIKKGEIEALGEKVVEALDKNGPLTTDALRKALPEGAVRSLGDKGKRIGVSSPLPPTLRVLEFAGRIERMVETGRLDTERYRWQKRLKNPFRSVELPNELAALAPRLAEIFLGAAGVARVEDFACWSGLSRRDAAAGLATLRTRPVEVEGSDGKWLSLAAAYVEDAPTTDDVHTLLGFEDNAFGLNVGSALFAEPRFHKMKVPSWGSSTKVSLGEARHLSSRPVIAEGRLAGFWDYDPEAKQAVVGLFDAVSKESKRRLAEEAAAVTRFLRDELGHGRSFSLDTDAELSKRAAWVRTLVPKASPKRKSAAAPKKQRVAAKSAKK